MGTFCLSVINYYVVEKTQPAEYSETYENN